MKNNYLEQLDDNLNKYFHFGHALLQSFWLLQSIPLWVCVVLIPGYFCLLAGCTGCFKEVDIIIIIII